MGKFDNIAILTDLDKTFLADGSKMVERNIEAIEYFKKEGGLFSLATGRMHFSLENTVVGVDKLVNAPAVMCNGTYFYDFQAQKRFCETFMDGEAVYKAVNFVHNHHETTRMRGSYKSGYVILEGDVYMKKELFDRGIMQVTELPLEKWNLSTWYKMVFLDTPQNLDLLEKSLRDRFPYIFEYNRSAETALELQMSGVNKSILFDSFREHYAKQGRKITLYACGDNENDIAMLKKADVAVCPSNAIERVKAVCDKCLCSNNEGVIADLIYSL